MNLESSVNNAELATAQGDEYFLKDQYEEALKCYSEAIVSHQTYYNASIFREP